MNKNKKNNYFISQPKFWVKGVALIIIIIIIIIGCTESSLATFTIPVMTDIISKTSINNIILHKEKIFNVFWTGDINEKSSYDKRC